jgi:hypothetical protein
MQAVCEGGRVYKKGLHSLAAADTLMSALISAATAEGHPAMFLSGREPEAGRKYSSQLPVCPPPWE